MQRLPEFDAGMAATLADAGAAGQVLRYVGRIDAGRQGHRGTDARSTASMPFANIALTDNVVRFATRRYCDNPLIVQGPGAGPEVTAGGVFSDLLRLSAYLGAHIWHHAKDSTVLTDVTAFAPATVANVGIGFDILGPHGRCGRRPGAHHARIDEPVVRIRVDHRHRGRTAGGPAAQHRRPRGAGDAARR